MIHPIILAGGSGTRLWPLSRKNYPKPLISPFGKLTLLQETAKRITADGFSSPTIICGEEIRFLVSQQLLDVGITPKQTILEPVGRNTTAAVAIGCLLTKSKNDVLLFMPADHRITNKNKFLRSMRLALPIAKSGKIVLFGIKPTMPATQYGYVRAKKTSSAKNYFSVDKFIEKPAAKVATKLMREENMFWNSGIFMATADTFLAEIKKHAPQIYKQAKFAAKNTKKDLEFTRIPAKHFKQIESISFDHAVLEKTDRTVVCGTDFGWSDVGNWKVIWDLSRKDKNKNVISGDAYAKDSYNCFISSDGPFVSSIGLKNTAVIVHSDAILVANIDQVESVKEIAIHLNKKQRPEADYHLKVYQPWGNHQTIDKEQKFVVKRLTIKPGHKTSTQIHKHRSEHWIVVQGKARINKAEETIELGANQSIQIPPQTQHRIENIGKEDLLMVEIQCGTILSDDDIVRLEGVL